MEIVPIISAALVIVLALTLLTLAISYLYNKVKKEEIVKPHKRKPKPVEQEEVIEDHLKPIPRPFADKKEKSIAEKEIVDDQKKRIGKISTQPKVDNNTGKPKIRNKRLTILKNLTDNTKQETKVKDSKKKIENEATNSLGGEILDKYMEEKDSSLYTLNVKAKKEKPKG